jgi:hypothetical protein
MNDTTVVQEKEESGFSWSGFIVGLVVGGALFLLTIQIVKALMFSLTAA